MRRVASQAARALRRNHASRTLTSRGGYRARTERLISAEEREAFYYRGQPLSVLQSSLFFRNFGLLIASTLVATGAWFAYSRDETSLTRDGAALNQSTALSSTSPISSFLSANTPSSTDRSALLQSSSAPVAVEESVPEQSRRALVVEDGQFFASEIKGNEPISKTSNNGNRLAVEMLTPDQATQLLRKNEQSYLVGRGRGVVRYDTTQLASNNPIEDDLAEKIIEYPVATSTEQSQASDWMFWGVFDGHSGWTTSAKLRQTLISYVARELNTTYQAAKTAGPSTLPSPDAIDLAIKQGFIKLDNEIVHDSAAKVFETPSRRAAAELLAPALSGSCALLSFYDSRSKQLRVACTGDSRAVLGRRGANGRWTATPLSEDQTGDTPSEVKRLQTEHPGEKYVVHKGRILGNLQPTRAFGDAVYKWSNEVSRRLTASYFGKTQSSLTLTPPYVTAEPVVTTTTIDPDKGDFLVMATDGLWECLSNEEVIGLVGQWVDSRSSSFLKSWTPSFLASQALPVDKSKSTSSDESARQAVRQQQWSIKSGDERFVTEDKNAATHLIRNALGGKDRDMVCALLSLPSPFSRRYRDDLTVQVIFFGKQEESEGRDVVRNLEACAPSGGEKAKL